MNTDHDEFTKLNKFLTVNRPDYVPHYLVLERNSKDPISGRPWKGARYRVSFEEAIKWLRAGFNIGVAGTDTDGLVIIDVDRAEAIMDVKIPTLVDRSRKRTGSHYFYFTDDLKAKVNIPTEKEGEVRSNYQYVVCAGSYVPTTLESLKAEGNPIPPDDQIPLLGKYTIEVAMPPAPITFDEFPKIFRDQALKAQATPTKKPRLKHERRDAEGPTSKIWEVRIEDIVGDVHTAGERFPSLFHDSATGKNTSVTPSSEDGPGLIHCWRHGVSLTPFQAIAVLAGLGDCVDIGEAHKGSMAGPSTLEYTTANVERIWNYAKKNKIVPEDDPHPFGEEAKKAKKKKADGITEDVDDLIQAGLYDPEIRDDVATYDQLTKAIKICVERRDENALWTIARASRFVHEHTMARYAATEALLIHNHFVTEAKLVKPEIYYYDASSGIYRNNGRQQIRAIIDAAIPDCASELKDNIIDKIIGRTRKFIEELKPPKGLICVKNGILDINRLILQPHSPDYFFLARFNAPFDPNARCPRFRQFLNDVILPEDIPALVEAIGYLLERDMPLHVMFFLLGEGRNGKGTLMYVLQQLVGAGNFSTKCLEGLANSAGFDRAYLYGMIANFSGEVTDHPLKHVGMLKQLSGGDVVDGDRKFLSSINWINAAKLWFAMNIPPFTEEITLAWWARIIIFEFRQVYMPGAAGTIVDLREQLSTEEELAGILNLAIEGYQRLMKRGWFSYNKSMEQVEDLWLTAADTVHGWIGACCEEDRSYAEELTKDDLYESYSAYCKEKKLGSSDRERFFTRLRKLCPWIREIRARSGDERVKVITGLRAEGISTLPREQAKLPDESANNPHPDESDNNPRHDESDNNPRHDIDTNIDTLCPVTPNDPDPPLAPQEGQGGQGQITPWGGTKKSLEERDDVNNDATEKKSATTLTTLTKNPKSAKLAPPVRVNLRSVPTQPENPEPPAPPKGEIGSDFVTLYRRCALQEPLKDWVIRRIVSAKASGDKFGPRDVRQEAPLAFASMMNEIKALADYMFADVEKIADYIHNENVDLDQAFQIMHQPREVPR